jgi:hypothetical protein
MNGWMLGLCATLFYLITQTMHSQVKFRNTVKLMRALSEILAEVTEIPDKQMGELKASMDAVEAKAKDGVLGGSVAWVLVALFLVCLFIRGHV